MAYSEQTWANGRDGGTKLNAARLQHMEDGIAAAAVVADVGTPGTTTGDALKAAFDPRLTVAATASANATLAANKHTPVDASGAARTMTLPTGQTEGARIIVEKVDSSTNTVTVSGSIRGSAGTVSLLGQFEAMSFLADSAGSWHPGPSHKTKAWLDNTYAGRAGGTSAVQAKLPFYNVRDYGATGDGTTNDTTAIQAALNAVPTSGATVYFPAGVYSVPSGGLTCANPVRIVGEPGLDGTGSRIYVTADAVTGLSLTGNRTAVEHLNIAHSLGGTRSASLIGLSVTNANFAHLNDVRIEGFGTDASVASGIYYSVLNCNFRDFVNTGLAYTNDTASGDAGDGTIQNCTFDRGSDTVSGGTACLWVSGGGMRFINNKINGKSSGSAWFQHGLRLVPDAIAQTGVIIVTGNSIENFTGYGVSVDQGSSTFYNSVLITGNEINGTAVSSGSTGVYLNNTPSGVAITGNHIYTTDIGIYLERVKHASVSGNSLTNIVTTGIHVGQFAKNIKIEPQPMDVVSGQHVLFDAPKVIADPSWELVVPFGGNNGSGMPVITDAAVHDQVEIDLITGFSTVLVDIDVTATVAGNGAWAARQQRLVAATNGGTATIATIGTDFAYQGTGAVITQTAGTSKVTFGVQKSAGTDLSGHMRIRVRGAALSSVKQLNRYN